MTPLQSVTTSELVISRLTQHGITHAFGVVGGAIMYLTDALRRNGNIQSIFTHHEQSAAIAAEAYGKLTNLPALVFATAGPGVTNIITGVVDAYMDSVPMVILIGDVRSTIAADFSKQRYNAPQEVNQDALISPIVKYYAKLSVDMDADAISNIIDTALDECRNGRPGPVCISLPLDVQAMNCSSSALNRPLPRRSSVMSDKCKSDSIDAIQNLLHSKRPLLLLGAGVRLSGAEHQVQNLIQNFNLPYCVTIGAVDLQDSNNPLSVGCVGPTSQRAANLCIQAADCVLALATSFDQSVTGFNIAELVENKRVFLVNVDPGELLRFDNPNIIPIAANLKDFFAAINGEKFQSEDHTNWQKKIHSVKMLVNEALEASMRTTVQSSYLSAYDITAELSRQLPVESTLVLGISLDAHSVFNAFHVTKGQRVIVSRNLGPMGWDIPALLGSAFTTSPPHTLVLITGDGSLMCNIQELAVVAGLNIPALIFVFNNDGYVSIRTTQSNFFGNQFFGCDTNSGLKIPPLKSLANGFKLDYERMDTLSDISNILERHQQSRTPCLVECFIAPTQLREPRLVSKVVDGIFKTPPIYEMTPNLDPDIKKLVDEILFYDEP